MAVFALRSSPHLRPVLWPLAAAIAALPFFVDHSLAFSADVERDLTLARFFAASSFAWAAFRTIEGAWGTSPAGAVRTFKDFHIYFTSSVDPRYEEDRSLAPVPGALRRRLVTILLRSLFVGLLASVLLPVGPSAPLASRVLPWLPWPLRPVAAVVAGTSFLWLFLAWCFDLGALPLLAQGLDVLEVFRNPVFGSVSPKEFWGRRWNRQVNGMLRRVAFQPLLALAGAPAAALVTFAVSAAFHEYQFALAMQSYSVGRVSLFFVTQGMLTAAETFATSALRRAPALESAVRRVPVWGKNFLTILSMTPFAPLFIDIWAEQGMFDMIARTTFSFQCAQ